MRTGLAHTAQATQSLRVDKQCSHVLGCVALLPPLLTGCRRHPPFVRRVLILDGISALDIGGHCHDGEGGPLRALLTPGMPQLTLPPSAGGWAVPPLETGAVVPGVAAALLTRRLLHSAAAAAILAILPDEGGHAAAAAHAVLAGAVRAAVGDAAAAALLAGVGRLPRAGGGGGANPLYL
jgi:hypothetical protein